MSHFTHRLNLVYEDDAGCSFQSSCRNVDWLLRELPDRDDRPDNQERVECHLDQIASFLFRTYQKCIRRFPCSFSDLLVLFVGSFMIVTFAERRLAAMTTIIKFLPHRLLEDA